MNSKTLILLFHDFLTSSSSTILTIAEIKTILEYLNKKNISNITLYNILNTLTATNKLIQVQNGLYINNINNNKNFRYELAGYLRKNAVISLQTVLGDAGFLNNYTDAITCIVPFYPSEITKTKPKLGLLNNKIGNFIFYGMPVNLIYNYQYDLFDKQTTYRKNIPEKALLDWIYLANSPKSNLTNPPLDVDLETINEKLAYKLADKIFGDKMKKQLQIYLQQVIDYNHFESSCVISSNDSFFSFNR